jgi:hypothetical protein
MHAVTFFDLFVPERRAINQQLDSLRVEIMKQDASVSGFNIGMNSGESRTYRINFLQQPRR